MFIYKDILTNTETKETFDAIGNNILTPMAQDTIGQVNAQLMSVPCKVRMDNAQDFEFKVGTKQLPWNAVANQPNTCALDLSSLEVADIAANCSQNNPVLFDGNSTTGVVKSIYWNDIQANPKCEIQFKDAPSQNNMNTYWHKQASYIKEANCQQAFQEVKDLTAETNKLKSDIADSEARIAVQEGIIRQKTEQLYSLNSKIQGLEQDKSNLQKDLLAVQKNLNDAKLQLADTQEERRLLDIQKNNMINDYERNLLDNKAAALKVKDDQIKALKDTYEADLKFRSDSLAAKDREINDHKNAANSAETEAANKKIELDNLKATNDRNQQILNSKTNTLNDLIKYPLYANKIVGNTCISQRCLTSPNAKYKACQQGDGHFVVYNNYTGAPIYATGKYGSQFTNGSLCIQEDGNLVNYYANGRGAYWATNTWTQSPVGPYTGEMLDSGDFVVKDRNNNVKWSSRSAGR
jgi:hypothetical protein